MTKDKKKHCTGPKIQRLLVDYIVKNFSYFRDNPVHLAWAMMWYSSIDRAWRIKRGWDNYENPKDYLIDQSEGNDGPLSEEDANLLYDAWGITVDNYQLFKDPAADPLSSKKNKTLDEWVAHLTSETYAHRSLFQGPNAKYRVWDQCLLTIGAGMDWNKDGYVCEDGPSGVDEAVYYGYTRCEKKVDPKIRKGVLKYVEMMAARPDIGKFVYEYCEKAIDNNNRINAGEDYFDVLDPDRFGKIRERMKAKADEKDHEKIEKFMDEIESGVKKADLERVEKALKKAKWLRQAAKAAEAAEKAEKKPIRLYPFCERYSCLCTMPDNAHESYIKAGIELCEMLLDGRAEVMSSFAPGEKEKFEAKHKRPFDHEQRKLAEKFLKKWKKNG